MRMLSHIFHLGVKELLSLLRDPVLLLFVFYGLTLQIIIAGNGLSLELRNASIGIVDEDHSPLSRQISGAFRPPQFGRVEALAYTDLDRALDGGRITFALVIPPRFEANLLAGRQPQMQNLVDATAVSQAFIGNTYIRRIVLDQVDRFLSRRPSRIDPRFEPTIRVRFNPNMQSNWSNSVAELLIMIAMLSVLLPGAALLREREHGTLEHLLVMPVTPAEILLAKFWANSLVLLVGVTISLFAVIGGYFEVPIRGSVALFLGGTLLFQLATSGIGIVLATVTRSVPQMALIGLVVVAPMAFLSGAWTPVEAMPAFLRSILWISPLAYYSEFANAVIYRGAGITDTATSLLAMAAIGAICFAFAMVRLRKSLTVARV